MYTTVIMAAFSCTLKRFHALNSPSLVNIPNTHPRFPIPMPFSCSDSFSASTMAIVVFAAAGLVDDFLLLTGVVLIHCTMHYGWMAEEMNRPMYDSESKKPTVWIKSADRPHTLVFDWMPCMAPAERLFPHILGYVPYLTIWGIFLTQFLQNATDEASGRSAPVFVYLIILGQFSIFTCFGFVQMFNLGFHNGPSWFCYGELTYILLSFVAKGLLGITLITSVFLFQSFEEAAAAS